jgi:hypothetical protein
VVYNNKLKDLYQQLVVDIEFGNIQIKEYANKKHNIELPLKKGNKVYLFKKKYQNKTPKYKIRLQKVRII